MNVKDQLKDISIASVAEGLGLGLKKHGANYQGECPTGHGSKGGRCFSLNTRSNYFSCFHCGKGGDVIELVMLAKGVEFLPAMRWLAEQYRADLVSLLEKSKAEASPEQREYYQRASLYDLVFEHGRRLLYEPVGQAALKYLLDERGYDREKLKLTDWIYWPPEEDIRAFLKKEHPEASEAIKALKLNGHFGDNFRLAFPYRDRRGAISGYLKRATAPKGITVTTYDDKHHEGVRWDSTPGLEKHDLFNLSRCRGQKELVIVEGYPDALYLPTVGLKNVAAVGQGLLSKTHLEGLKAAGVQRVIICFDNDEAGPENTPKALDLLKGSGIRALVLDPPLMAPHKDPDELVKAQGIEAFKALLERAEIGSRWLARRIASKHAFETDLGRVRAIDEALEACYGVEGKAEQRIFKETFGEATGISGEELAMRAEQFEEEAARKQAEKTLKELARKIEASGADLAGAEDELRKGLHALQQQRGAEIPEPYLLDELVSDILGTKDGLKTGYPKLDELVRIPQGAITIAAARPGHGKTTLQLNLLLNLAREYPDRSFVFFSYEEARKWLALKLLMILSGVDLKTNEHSSLTGYMEYLRYKRGQGLLGKDNAYLNVEKAVQEYERLVGTGRIILSDRMLPGEELAATIGHLTGSRKIGAIFIDYIQKIPLQTAIQGQRYQEIKKVSELLLEQAVTRDIPIIMGAQLSRPPKGVADQSRTIKLENLRESGDIEQDANLVLGLYNGSVVEMEDQENDERARIREVELEVHVLKNRAGIAGKKVKLTFDRPVLRIKDRPDGGY